MRKIGSKRGALELSIGTIVIIVLAMSMLILGLVLVRNIFTGAIGAAELIDNKVRAEINTLFDDEGTRTVVYLADNQAELKKGKKYNVRFSIRNTVRGEGTAGQFSYVVSVDEVESGCQLTLQKAETFIVLGKNGGPIPIIPGGEPVERVIQIRPTETAPLCSITYNIRVTKDGQDYDTNFFIIDII